MKSLLSLLILSTSLYAAEIHWGYNKEIGPDRWANISSAFASCKTGYNQSPINIVAAKNTHLEKITFDYPTTQGTLLNNGHTIQFSPMNKQFLYNEKESYQLIQFHFHSPSENLIDGQSYPLEAHFVHEDTNGQILVLAVLYQEGKENKTLKKLWDKLPNLATTSHEMNHFNIRNLIPEHFEYYRFSGSLTTPPCTEGITWIVTDQHPTLSKEQIAQFYQLMGGPTNRPIQPIHGRIINHT